MIIQSLVILNWALWTALFIALVYALFTFLTERRPSAKTGSGLGLFLVGLGLLFSIATAMLLLWLAEQQSLTGLVLMLLLLAWPLVPLIAGPLGTAIKKGKEVLAGTSPGNLPRSKGLVA